MSLILRVDCKPEPASPLNDEVVWLTEDTFYQTFRDDEDIKFEYHNDDDNLELYESKVEAASLILENLENLVDLDELIKEESYLLDEKILPLLDDVVDPPCGDVVQISVQDAIKMEYNEAQETQFFLKEFETVYGAVELSHHGALTPPQSPPIQPILTTLEPLLTTTTTTLSSSSLPPIYTNLSEKSYLSPLVPEKLRLHSPTPLPHNVVVTSSMVYSPQPDLAHELAVVDELVRSRVEDMQWATNGPLSPNSTSSSSSSSHFDDSSSEDPEWVPETVESFDENLSGTIKSPSLVKSKTTKKRSKPYSRSGPTDKRSRKKEQNKNAATRYRMKKKAEVEVILSEEKGLMDHRDDLGNQVVDLEREIKYLKGLMRDLFKAKGLIN